MKKILFTIASATVLLTACNNQKKDNLNTEKQIVFTDTSLLKQSNVSTDKAMENETAVSEPQKTQAPVRTITKYVRVRETQPRREPVTNSEPVNQAPAPTQSETGTANVGDGPVATPQTVPQKKKGWSDAAKGATIGGVGGAVAGAVISKNKGKGAIIGGVIGAAGGYILGRKADKKSGRAQVATP